MPRDELSGAQLEKLGDRLRRGPLALDDLRQLRAFLKTLEPFAEDIFAQVRDANADIANLRSARVVRRSSKTPRSILAKLRRQTTTLAQIQDLVGCRAVVPDIIDQDAWLTKLRSLFPTATIVDRRTKASPSGYRAVHVIVRNGIQRFEIQLRTALQDSWANIVERIADRLGLEIKYGGGNPLIQQVLGMLSEVIAARENFQDRWQAHLVHPLLATNAMRIEPMPRLDAAFGPGQSTPQMSGGELLLSSNRRLPSGAEVSIGRPGTRPERAVVTVESTLSEEMQKWLPFNFLYHLSFENRQHIIDKYFEEWEDDQKREEQMVGVMSALEDLVQ